MDNYNTYYQHINFSNYLSSSYIYHVYLVNNFNCFYLFIYLLFRFIGRRTIVSTNETRINVNNNNNNKTKFRYISNYKSTHRKFRKKYVKKDMTIVIKKSKLKQKLFYKLFYKLFDSLRRKRRILHKQVKHLFPKWYY